MLFRSAPWFGDDRFVDGFRREGGRVGEEGFGRRHGANVLRGGLRRAAANTTNTLTTRGDFAIVKEAVSGPRRVKTVSKFAAIAFAAGPGGAFGRTAVARQERHEPSPGPGRRDVHGTRPRQQPRQPRGEGAMFAGLLEQVFTPEQYGTNVATVPGSREREVAKLWPVLMEIADRLPSDVKCVAAAASETTARLMQHPLIEVQVGAAREWMQKATLAITASGTATMECAFAGCPMIVVYKVNWLTYLVGRALVTVKWLAMPNVIAGRAIVPEFIQHALDARKIAELAHDLLADHGRREAMRQELAAVVGTLGGPGASARAAELIWEQVR